MLRLDGSKQIRVLRHGHRDGEVGREQIDGRLVASDEITSAGLETGTHEEPCLALEAPHPQNLNWKLLDQCIDVANQLTGFGWA